MSSASSLSISPSQESHTSSNIYDIEPTDLHLKNVALSRKIARAERKLEEFIKNINDESLAKVEKRRGRLNEKSIEEDSYRQHKEATEHVKEQYKFEADAAIEIIAQTTANLKYHERQVQLLMPPWVSYMNNALAILTSTGHRPNWRSVVKKELSTSLDAMGATEIAATPTAIIYSLQQLILNINAIKGQKLISSLQQLVADYIATLPPDSKLGQHSNVITALKQRLIQLKQVPVPLSSGHWSSELKSLSQVKNTLSMTSEHVSRDFHDTSQLNASAYDTPLPDIATTQEPVTAYVRPTSQSRSRVAPHPDALPHILAELRQAAIAGSIDTAWSIYYHYFPADRPLNTVAISNKLHLLPTISMYHHIAAAFKNSSIKPNFDHINLILEQLQQYSLSPDSHIMNITLAACRASGQWRLALYWFNRYRNEFGLQPTSTSTRLLLDSCRHGLDEPAEIFETLRCHNLPRSFCYKAASINAGNRVSQQTTFEALPLLESRKPNRSKLLDNSPHPLNMTFSTTTIPNPNTVPSANISASDPTYRFKQFKDTMTSTLRYNSPAKHSNGLSTSAFETQLKRIVKLRKPISGGDIGMRSRYDGSWKSENFYSSSMLPAGRITGAQLEDSVILNDFE